MGTPEEPFLKEKEIPKKNTIREKIIQIKENITVEPVITSYMMAIYLSFLAMSDLNLDKACRVNKQYSGKICDALIAREENMYMKEELTVQELVAWMETWNNIVISAVPSFLVLFIGAWSDKTGKRKICIILPITGNLLASCSCILTTYFFYEVPMEVTMVFEVFFPAITGDWVITVMGVYAYISDVSSEESRMFRLGIANMCSVIGGFIGFVLSGILLELTGYYGVFTITSLLYLFSIVYGFIYIKDPERQRGRKSIKNKSSNVLGFLKSFFHIKHAKDTLTVALKKGPNKRRTKFILVLASMMFIFGPYCAEERLCYLFTRYRFSWDALKYSIYITYIICMYSIGTLISLCVFSRRLKWDDSALGLISACSKIVGAIITACARNTRDMYIAGTAVMFNQTSMTALISIASKLVTSDELGKVTSIINLTQVVSSLVIVPIYSWIYMITLQVDVGVIYYVSTMLSIPPILFFLWFFIQSRKDDKLHGKTKFIEVNKENGTELETKENEVKLLSSTDVEHEAMI